MDKKISMYNKVLRKFVNFVTKFNYLVIALVLALTVFFSINLLNLRVDANVFDISADIAEPTFTLNKIEKPIEEYSFSKVESKNIHEPYIDEDRIKAEVVDLDQYKGKKLKSKFSYEMIVLFSSDVLFEKETMNLLVNTMKEFESLNFVGSSLSVFNYPTLEKNRSRIQIAPMVKKDIVFTDENVLEFKERLLSDKIAENYLYSSNGKTLLFLFQLDNVDDETIKAMEYAFEPLRDYGKITTNNGTILSNRVSHYIVKDLSVLLSLAIIIILILYYFSFKSKRGVVVPCTNSLIGLIWTLGFMTLLGFKVTIVGILTPCLVLILGSSYSIHMVCEYFEVEDKTNLESKRKAFTKITKTIISASITTIAGFIVLSTSELALIKEFAISVSFGIFFSCILAITYIPAILSIPTKVNRKKAKESNDNIVNKFVKSTTKFVFKHYIIVLVVSIIIAMGFFLVKDQISFNSNYISYYPPNDILAKDTIFFADEMGGVDPYLIQIKAANDEKNYFLKSENLTKVFEYEQKILESCPDIKHILSFSQYVAFANYKHSGVFEIPESNALISYIYRLLSGMKNTFDVPLLADIINDDGNKLLLSIRNYDSQANNVLSTESTRRIYTATEHYRYLLPNDSEFKADSGILDMMYSIEKLLEEQSDSTILTIVAIIIISILTLISVNLGVITIAPVLIGIMFNHIIMYLFNIPFDIVTVSFSSISIGAGIDDAIHCMIRYKDNKKNYSATLDTRGLLSKTLNEAGKPIVLTTVSICAGMAVFAFASFVPIKYFGLFMFCSLTMAMLSTLVLLPSIILLLDSLKKRTN